MVTSRSRVFLIVSVFAGILASASTAFATSSVYTYTIHNDRGGVLGEYIYRYDQMRRDGTHVIVDGRCDSACTMLLGALPTGSVCVTPRARFGFHSGYRIDDYDRPVYSREATNILLDHYPPVIRDWINASGGLPNAARTRRMIFLSGKRLVVMGYYRQCD